MPYDKIYIECLASINPPNLHLFWWANLENLLLPSKSSLLKSMKSTIPVISSPLQRYHDENFAVIIAHSPMFSGKITCENAERASSRHIAAQFLI